MNRFILFMAVGFLLMSVYFFAIKDLFWGSIATLMCVVFNLIFAMIGDTNRS